MNPPTTPPHPDDQLSAPLRWATRLFSSWRVLIALAGLTALYVAAAYVPIGGRYLWQVSWIDAPQSRVLTWQPFHVLLMLLACVMLWTVIRRVCWRFRNVGLFLATLGCGSALIGLSVGWRYQTRGLLAVQSADAEPLPLQTRYLDPARRVLFVQIGQSPPQQIPLGGLPLWHDLGPGRLALPLHAQPGLRSQLDYRAQVHAVAYIADGSLTTSDESADGRRLQAPLPTAQGEREFPLNDCPTDALLALRFTSNSAEGPAGETVVWLPFDLAAGQRVMPPKAYDIPGLGEIRIAFTLANQELGFAVAAEPNSSGMTLRIIDTDPVTRQIIPEKVTALAGNMSAYYRPTSPKPTLREAVITQGPWDRDTPPRWMTLRSTTARVFTYISVAVVLSGLLPTLIFRILPSRTSTDATG